MGRRVQHRSPGPVTRRRHPGGTVLCSPGRPAPRAAGRAGGAAQPAARRGLGESARLGQRGDLRVLAADLRGRCTRRRPRRRRRAAATHLARRRTHQNRATHQPRGGPQEEGIRSTDTGLIWLRSVKDQPTLTSSINRTRSAPPRATKVLAGVPLSSSPGSEGDNG